MFGGIGRCNCEVPAAVLWRDTPRPENSPRRWRGSNSSGRRAYLRHELPAGPSQCCPDQPPQTPMELSILITSTGHVSGIKDNSSDSHWRETKPSNHEFYRFVTFDAFAKNLRFSRERLWKDNRLTPSPFSLGYLIPTGQEPWVDPGNRLEVCPLEAYISLP